MKTQRSRGRQGHKPVLFYNLIQNCFLSANTQQTQKQITGIVLSTTNHLFSQQQQKRPFKLLPYWTSYLMWLDQSCFITSMFFSKKPTILSEHSFLVTVHMPSKNGTTNFFKIALRKSEVRRHAQFSDIVMIHLWLNTGKS